MESDAERRRRYRPGRGCSAGCGTGCGGFFFVLIVGIALSLFNLTLAIGFSVRIPFTTANLTLAGSVGAKAKTAAALPPYTYGRLGSNRDFINSSQTMTIGPAEGAGLVVLGDQEGAPPLDLRLVAR